MATAAACISHQLLPSTCSGSTPAMVLNSQTSRSPPSPACDNPALVAFQDRGLLPTAVFFPRGSTSPDLLSRKDLPPVLYKLYTESQSSSFLTCAKWESVEDSLQSTASTFPTEITFCHPIIPLSVAIQGGCRGQLRMGGRPRGAARLFSRYKLQTSPCTERGQHCDLPI